MNKIGKYFKVYPLKVLRTFPHWKEMSHTIQKHENLDDNAHVYLQDNYVVTKGIFKDRQIIFEDVTEEWVIFCQNQLGFRSPAYGEGALVFEKGIVGERLPPIVRCDFDPDKPQYWWRMFGMVCEVPDSLNAFQLRHIVRQLVTQYDGLRLRIVKDENGYRKFIALVDPNVFIEQDVSSLSEEDQGHALREILEAQWASLDLAKGPLLRFVYINRGPTRLASLIVIIHHALMDGYSLGLFLNDFEEACRQLIQGKPVNILLSTATFKNWAERMDDYCRSEAGKQDFEWWLSLHWERFRLLPVDYPENQIITKVAPSGAIQGYYRYPKEIAVWGKLTVKETQALLEVPQIYQVGFTDVLLAGLALAFYRWQEVSPLYVIINDNNRYFFDDLDLTRTIGFLTSSCPVLLELPTHEGMQDYGNILNSIKDQLARIPHHGNPWNWFEICYADLIEAQLPNLAHLFFLYNGDSSQIVPIEDRVSSSVLEPMNFPAQDEQLEPIETELLQQSLAFGSVADIDNGEFRFRLMYKEGLHSQATAESIVQIYMEVLRTFIQSSVQNSSVIEVNT